MKHILFSGLSVATIFAWMVAPASADSQSPTRFNNGRAMDTVELSKSVSDGPTRFSDGRASEGPTRFNDGNMSDGPTRFNDGNLIDADK